RRTEAGPESLEHAASPNTRQSEATARADQRRIGISSAERRNLRCDGTCGATEPAVMARGATKRRCARHCAQSSHQVAGRGRQLSDINGTNTSPGLALVIAATPTP